MWDAICELLNGAFQGFIGSTLFLALLLAYICLTAYLGINIHELKKTPNTRELMTYRIFFHGLLQPLHYLWACLASTYYLINLPTKRARTPRAVYDELYKDWDVPDTLFKKNSWAFVYIVYPCLAILLLSSAFFIS